MPNLLLGFLIGGGLAAVAIICWAAALVDNRHEPDRHDAGGPR
jgi:hypothetical protein